MNEKSIKITNAVAEDGTPAADYYITFDPTRGFSEGSSGSGSSGGRSNDNSDYIRDMYEAQKAAALAEIETAWAKNQAALDRAGTGVKEYHQTARNQSAGDAAVADGHTELWDLADHFGVTEDFMRKAVCWYTHGNLATELYF